MPYVHLLRTLLHQGLGNVHESQITPDSVKAARIKLHHHYRTVSRLKRSSTFRSIPRNTEVFLFEHSRFIFAPTPIVQDVVERHTLRLSEDKKGLAFVSLERGIQHSMDEGHFRLVGSPCDDVPPRVHITDEVPANEKAIVAFRSVIAMLGRSMYGRIAK